MTDHGSPVVMPANSLSRLMDQEVMRAIISPDGAVPGPADISIRLAEF